MGKNAIIRQPNEARARLSNLRTSPIKLNEVAKMIRGMSVDEAKTQLLFNHRRIAKDVHKLLDSAIANAENNHDLNIDDLVVKEAYVGKAMKMKRFRARARGRGAKIEKPFSHMTIILREESK